MKAVSQATLDADAADVKGTKAQVEEQQALVAKKLIRAPFAGRAGIRAVDLGQYLSPGTKIVTLQALDPIFVDFLVPQAALGRYRVGPEGERDEPTASRARSSTATSPRSIRRWTRRRATSRCAPRCATRSSGCCRACSRSCETALGGPQRLLTLPQTAISFNPYGNTVFVLEEKKGADGKAQLVGAAEIRHHRRDARRPDRGALGREGRRDRGDLGPDQAAERLGGR